MKSLPLLALPGLLNDERLWQRQTADLRSQHPVTSFAMTGHDTMQAMASAVLARAPAERFALAGLSMGGYVALEIMRQAPERVAALALLDTSARPDTPQQTGMRLATIAQAGANSSANPGANPDAGFDAVMTGMLPRLVHPAHIDDAAIVDTLAAMARSIGLQGFAQQQHCVISRADSRSTLSRIRCPTLVLCGREDQLTPLALHEEMATGIAGAKLVVLETCGHLSPLEQPEPVTIALRDWLASAST